MAREPYASSAIGIVELIVPDDPALDEDIRRLSIALVRKGVTSTVTRHDGDRYGVMHIDSNLPDVRIAIGGPSDNRFVAELLEASGSDYRDEFERQLSADGRARMWVSAAPEARRQEAFPDLRGVRALPVLIVAGDVEALADDLEDAVVDVVQPRGLAGPMGLVEDYTVAVLNRGPARLQRRAEGATSTCRCCGRAAAGRPVSGSTRPRRSVPDGSNFQFQHWTPHVRLRADGSSIGDWRSADTVRIGHEYNNPLIAARPGRASRRAARHDELRARGTDDRSCCRC